jgi:hypothetical protein
MIGLVIASSPICRPAFVDQVKVITRGMGWLTKASPISRAGPATTLSTPGGSPRFLKYLGKDQTTRDGSIRGWFQHDRVSQRQGRGDRAISKVEGKVPRADYSYYTHGAAVDSAFLPRMSEGRMRPSAP